jgi:hypothetical protein
MVELKQSYTNSPLLFSSPGLSMTRLELLTIVTGRARTNGFEFRRWYTTRLGLPWISTEAALTLLDQQRRYYALLFSHDFACAFWKAGEDITFAVPAQTFERRMPDGSVATVTRKPFMRRSARRDAWRYHLREMALAEDPLRYLRKYLHVEEELDEEPSPVVAPEPNPQSAPRDAVKRGRGRPKKSVASADGTKAAKAKPFPRPLPAGTPSFLRRPYP